VSKLFGKKLNMPKINIEQAESLVLEFKNGSCFGSCRFFCRC